MRLCFISFAFAVTFLFPVSQAGHAQSCIGPDYPQSQSVIPLPENLCADYSFRGRRGSAPAYINVTLIYAGKTFAKSVILETQQSPAIICGPEVKGYDLCLGYRNVEITDEWCKICPQLILKFGVGPWEKESKEPMMCIKLGDDHEDDVPQIVQGANRFAFDLLGTDTMAAGMDTFVSPFNLVNALIMPCMAAGGNTLTQLMATLHIDKTNLYWAQAFGTLRKSMEYTEPNAVTNILNRLWLATAWMPRVNPEISRRYKNFGEIKSANFAEGPQVETYLINQWVYESTRGRIDNALDSHNLTKYTVAVFTSVLYFSAKWETPFPHTIKQTFTDEKNEEIAVTMMEAKKTYLKVYEDANVQVVELPFAGELSSLSFIVIRPAREDERTTVQIENSLDKSELDTWLRGMKLRYFESFYMPEYMMFNVHDVTDVLKQLGVRDLFDPSRADMKNLTTDHLDVYEDAINRQDFLSVGQQGVEAAAIATDGTGHDKATQGPIYHADRPFVFIVMDRSNDIILFVGRVTNPQGWRLETRDHHGHRHHGGVGVFFLVLILILVFYCGCGYLYNSRQSGTQGVENVPHISAMRSCVNAIKTQYRALKGEEESEDAMMPGDDQTGSYFVPSYGERAAYGHLETEQDL